jgi:hypothetical protein
MRFRSDAASCCSSRIAQVRALPAHHAFAEARAYAEGSTGSGVGCF